VSGVDETISPRDNMFQAHRRDHYFAVGRGAVAIIALAMIKAGIDKFANVLDLPCGSGRVLRHLVRFLPEASVVASDKIPRTPPILCASVYATGAWDRSGRHVLELRSEVRDHALQVAPVERLIAAPNDLHILLRHRLLPHPGGFYGLSPLHVVADTILPRRSE
jgi:SAM-dependent methyltransferase